MENKVQTFGGINLLEGEEWAYRIGDATYGLLLTNKRVIKRTRYGRTSETTVAFLHDIVTATIDHSVRNTLLLFIGTILELAGLGWFWYEGSRSSLDNVITWGPLAAGLVLGVIFTAWYLMSASARIDIKTAFHDIDFKLSNESYIHAYPFINRYSELKDKMLRFPEKSTSTHHDDKGAG